MLHWLYTAFNTYVLHPERGNGYQWWSGEGSDLSELLGPLLAVAAYLQHHNCHHKPCWHRGHPHPEHGWPACRRHWNEPLVLPTPAPAQ